MAKPRIKLEMSGPEVLRAMSGGGLFDGGDVGAYGVCWHLLLNSGRSSLQLLDDLEIYQDRIWKLYKYVCGQNPSKMVAVLRAASLNLAGVDVRTLNEAIDNGASSINLDIVVTAVTNHTPSFNDQALSARAN